MLTTCVNDINGNEIARYTWDTYDSEQALLNAFRQIQSEGLPYEDGTIHVFDESGEHINMICL